MQWAFNWETQKVTRGLVSTGSCISSSTVERRLSLLGLLNELWPFVNMRKNQFLPTKKVTGYHLSRNGQSVRSYDDPCTPAQRVKETGIMLEPQHHQMDELHASLDLAVLTNQINEIQQRLIRLAAAKTYSQAQ